MKTLAPSRLCYPCSVFVAAAISALLCGNFAQIRAETFSTAGGTLNWNSTANWVEGTIPNAVGANAIFNSPVTNTSATLAGTSAGGGITVGSLTFNDTLATTIGIPNGTAGGPLKFDNGGAGATILTMGSGTGNNTISATMVLNDVLTAQVDQTTAASGAGSLNLTGAISGPGAIIKQGDGLMTFGTAAKTYTGATVLNGGRTRISNIAQPSATSAFTINSGAQLTLIAAGNFAFGTGVLTLNGAGATSGPYSPFPGAIRNDTNLAVTIANAVVLQTDTLIHVQGAATGSVTFPNTISGPGSLILMARASDANLGQLVLTGTNTYAGGTVVNGGVLNVNSDAALGAPGSALTLDGLFFNGFLNPILRASGNISTTARRLIVGNVGNNIGGTIDTNGNDVTFGAGSSIAGTTLTKTGTGKLVLAGAQNYDTLTTSAGRTEIGSALMGGNAGLATINANAATNISVGQTLAALNIGSGSVVTLGAPLPPAPEFVDALENRWLAPEMGDQLVGSAGGQAVPEPCSTALLLGGASPRRRRVNAAAPSRRYGQSENSTACVARMQGRCQRCRAD